VKLCEDGMGIHEHHECSKNNGILHNDFQRTSCCIFHLTNVVYIGVCDWCENKHMQEVTPSLYAFVKEQDAINARETF
jgi:hypothetical protein